MPLKAMASLKYLKHHVHVFLHTQHPLPNSIILRCKCIHVPVKAASRGSAVDSWTSSNSAMCKISRLLVGLPELLPKDDGSRIEFTT